MTRGERNCKWLEKHLCYPSGKLAGKPVKLADFQRADMLALYDNPAVTRTMILSYARKNAKHLSIDTPIPTPTGWRRVDSLDYGDTVFGADGKPCRVIATSPLTFNKPCYRVEFSDGTHVIASDDHRWKTRHRYRPWAKRRVNGSGFGGRHVVDVVTTAQIAASVMQRRADGALSYNHGIDVAGALQTPNVDLSLDPYLLGLWLGNGTATTAQLTCGDADIAHYEDELCQILGGMPSARKAVTSSGTRWTVGLTHAHIHGHIKARLRDIGVLGNKHIPALYLWAGTEQRRDLLQGLMDSDGTITPTGHSGTMSCCYTTALPALAEGVATLVRSLGIKASIRSRPSMFNGQDCGLAYAVQFTAWQDDAVFRMARKASRLKPRPQGKRLRSDTLMITSCELVPSVPLKCIAVDSPDHLFLAGPGMTPTHNTFFAACIVLLHLAGPEAVPNGELYSAARSKKQAAILYKQASDMVKMSPTLSLVVGLRDNTKELYCQELGTCYQALSAEAKTKLGLLPELLIHDELGQVRGPADALTEALETATAASANPISIIISTQAASDNDLLSIMIDDALTGADPRTVLRLYTAPKMRIDEHGKEVDTDPFSLESIKAANPGFGIIQSEKEVLRMAEDARRMPSKEAAYRNLVLNQRVETFASFISREIWMACAGDVTVPPPGCHEYLGLDLSMVNDLTALLHIWEVNDTLVIKPHFWMPAANIQNKSSADKVPYDIWAKAGLITLVPGASVDYSFVAPVVAQIIRERPGIRAAGFDRWNWPHFERELKRVTPKLTTKQLAKWKPVGQGTATMSPALRVLETAILNKKLLHGDHPVMNMCMANAVVSSPDDANRKLEKHKSKGRIDGAVALCDAVAAMLADDDKDSKPTFTLVSI